MVGKGCKNTTKFITKAPLHRKLHVAHRKWDKSKTKTPLSISFNRQVTQPLITASQHLISSDKFLTSEKIFVYALIVAQGLTILILDNTVPRFSRWLNVVWYFHFLPVVLNSSRIIYSMIGYLNTRVIIVFSTTDPSDFYGIVIVVTYYFSGITRPVWKRKKLKQDCATELFISVLLIKQLPLVPMQ